MRDNILIVLAVLILATMWFQISTQNTKYRYDVITGSNMLTILVDKKTGNTWRNCICGDKTPIPGCWEKMTTLNAEEFNKPIGEVKTRRKMAALQKKMQNNVQQIPQQQAPQETK